jgi:hypothetical protein
MSLKENREPKQPNQAFFVQFIETRESMNGKAGGQD